MSIMNDPAGPPYPYPEPLPNEAKQTHLDAVHAWQRRTNWWTGLVLMPGICCIIISVAWGNTRNSEGTASLWLTNPALAAAWLYIGLTVTAVGVIATTWVIRKKNKHIRLLAAYGIHVDPDTSKVTSQPG